MKPKLSSNLILRVDEELKRRLADVQSQTGYSVSEVVRQCFCLLYTSDAADE